MRNNYDLARDPSTPPDVLTTLSTHWISWIRRLVARNPNTSHETLTFLSQDEEYGVRWDVVGNPNTPYRVWIRPYGRMLP